MSVNADAAVLQPIKTDKLRARVAGTPAHLGVLPQVPTLKELSFESANRMSVFGVYAPVGVPATMLDRQHAEVNKALATPALREPLTASDNVPASTSRAEFNQQIAADFHINSRRIKAAFIKAR